MWNHLHWSLKPLTIHQGCALNASKSIAANLWDPQKDEPPLRCAVNYPNNELQFLPINTVATAMTILTSLHTQFQMIAECMIRRVIVQATGGKSLSDTGCLLR